MTTVLLSEKEQLISVPNDLLIRDVVVNTSPQAWKEVTIPVSFGGNVDLATFESELLKSLVKLRTRLDPRFPPVLTTKARSTTSTDLVLTLMLRHPEDRDAITAEANKRFTDVLDRVRGVRRSGRPSSAVHPRPHRTVHELPDPLIEWARGHIVDDAADLGSSVGHRRGEGRAAEEFHVVLRIADRRERPTSQAQLGQGGARSRQLRDPRR